MSHRRKRIRAEDLIFGRIGLNRLGLTVRELEQIGDDQLFEKLERLGYEWKGDWYKTRKGVKASENNL